MHDSSSTLLPMQFRTTRWRNNISTCYPWIRLKSPVSAVGTGSPQATASASSGCTSPRLINAYTTPVSRLPATIASR